MIAQLDDEKEKGSERLYKYHKKYCCERHERDLSATDCLELSVFSLETFDGLIEMTFLLFVLFAFVMNGLGQMGDQRFFRPESMSQDVDVVFQCFTF